MSLQKTLDAFFDENNIANTMTHLINNNSGHLQDPVFEISCLCLSSAINIVLGNQGIAYFKKNYTVLMSYDHVNVRQLELLIDLVRSCLKKHSLCITEERSGNMWITILEPIHYSADHTKILVGLHELLHKSASEIQFCKFHLTNILFQRINNTIFVDPKSIVEVREIIQKQRKVEGSNAAFTEKHRSLEKT